MEIMDLIASTLAFDEEINKASENHGPKLTFERDEAGVLWSVDEAGNKVGRIFEHGDDDPNIDHIEEV